MCRAARRVEQVFDARGRLGPLFDIEYPHLPHLSYSTHHPRKRTSLFVS